MFISKLPLQATFDTFPLQHIQDLKLNKRTLFVLMFSLPEHSYSSLNALICFTRQSTSKLT